MIDFQGKEDGGFTASWGDTVPPHNRQDALSFHYPSPGTHGPLLEVWSHGLSTHVAQLALEELCKKCATAATPWSDLDQQELGACAEYIKLANAGNASALLSFVEKNYLFLPNNARGPCLMAKTDIGNVSKKK